MNVYKDNSKKNKQDAWEGRWRGGGGRVPVGLVLKHLWSIENADLEHEIKNIKFSSQFFHLVPISIYLIHTYDFL